MKQTVNFNNFVDAFHACDRYDQFGYEALRILFDHLEAYEDDTGEQIELDVIGLCCAYSVDTVQDIANRYGIDTSGCEDDQDLFDTVMEYLQNNTIVCGSFKGADGDYIVYCSEF